MIRKYLFLIGLTFLAYQIVQILAKVELTNVKCIPLDKTFANFETCQMTSINRTYKYVSFKINLFQVPVTNVTVKVILLKRFNDYRPFLYNVTFDACRFLASNKRSPVYSAFYGFFAHHSNMNHTCPFDHDLIVDKVTTEFINQHIGKVFPVPSGDYALFTSWHAYGVNRANVRLYVTIS